MQYARGANTLLFLLVLSVTINYLDRGALSISAPLIAGELHLTDAQMGILFSAFFWSYAGFQLLAGWLVDRYPLKWVYAVAFLVWSLSTAAVALVHSFSALLAARFLLGAGESVAYPACSKIILRSFPEHRRGFANALVDAGSKAGPGLSTLVGAYAVASYGWRGLFLVAGLGSLLWLIPWMFWKEQGQHTGDATHGPSPSWTDLLRRRQLWGTSLGMFALGYVLYFLLSWLPSYLVRERGVSMSELGWLGSAPFWTMGVASLAGGWTSDRLIAWGRDAGSVRRTYTVSGLLLCGFAILPVPLATSPAVSVLLISASCAFLGLFTSNVWAVTQSLAGPLAVGRWTGIQNAVGNLGGVVSPAVTGWIVAGTGSFSLAFAAAALVLAAGAAAYYFMLGRIDAVEWRIPITRLPGTNAISHATLD